MLRGCFLKALRNKNSAPEISLVKKSRFWNVNVNADDFKIPYFPLKSIDFSGRKYYPIFQLAHEEQDSRWFKRALFSSYIIPGAYFANFIFFFDWTFTPHYVAMAALFFLGSKRMANFMITVGSQVQELHIGKSGDDFALVLEKSLYSNELIGSDEIVSNVLAPSESLTILFNVKDVKKIAYLSNYMHKKLNAGMESEAKEEKKDEKSWKDYYGTEKVDSAINTPSLKDSVIVFEIQKEGEKPTVFTLKAGYNANMGYNDYIAAFAERKKIMIKERS